MKNLERAATLPCWSGPVIPRPMGGGITNVNYAVEDRGRKFVVRIGDDIPVHHILRWHEKAASHAAAKAGLSPAIIYDAPGVMVMDFIEGDAFTEEDVQDPRNLNALALLLKRAHTELMLHLNGPALAFWPFHLNRDYLARLTRERSRHASRLATMMAINQKLEVALGRSEERRVGKEC